MGSCWPKTEVHSRLSFANFRSDVLTLSVRVAKRFHNQSSSARTFTVLPFTLPAVNLFTASRAMSRVTAT